MCNRAQRKKTHRNVIKRMYGRHKLNIFCQSLITQDQMDYLLQKKNVKKATRDLYTAKTVPVAI